MGPGRSARHSLVLNSDYRILLTPVKQSSRFIPSSHALGVKVYKLKLPGRTKNSLWVSCSSESLTNILRSRNFGLFSILITDEVSSYQFRLSAHENELPFLRVYSIQSFSQSRSLTASSWLSTRSIFLSVRILEVHTYTPATPTAWISSSFL